MSLRAGSVGTTGAPHKMKAAVEVMEARAPNEGASAPGPPSLEPRAPSPRDPLSRPRRFRRSALQIGAHCACASSHWRTGVCAVGLGPSGARGFRATDCPLCIWGLQPPFALPMTGSPSLESGK